MKKVFIFILLISFYNGYTQDTLPKVSVKKISNKIILSWNNNYTSTLTDILIQRSNDSITGYKTIAQMLNPNNRQNGFVDQKAPNGRNYYRLFITFPGGNYIFSKVYRPVIDTAFKLSDSLVQVNESKTGFTQSKNVFAVKENNIQIKFPNPRKKYAIKFLEETGKLLFEIKSLPENNLIIDKTNFTKSGTYFFELYEENVLIERNKVIIPRNLK